MGASRVLLKAFATAALVIAVPLEPLALRGALSPTHAIPAASGRTVALGVTG